MLAADSAVTVESVQNGGPIENCRATPTPATPESPVAIGAVREGGPSAFRKRSPRVDDEQDNQENRPGPGRIVSPEGVHSPVLSGTPPPRSQNSRLPTFTMKLKDFPTRCAGASGAPGQIDLKDDPYTVTVLFELVNPIAQVMLIEPMAV